MESVPKETTYMFILDYVIYRIVAVMLEMFWDKIVLGSRLYTRIKVLLYLSFDLNNRPSQVRYFSSSNPLRKNLISTNLNCPNFNSMFKISDFFHMPCTNIYNERERKKADTISCSIVIFPTVFIFILDKSVWFFMQIYFHA